MAGRPEHAELILSMTEMPQAKTANGAMNIYLQIPALAIKPYVFG